MAAAEKSPTAEWSIDIEAGTISGPVKESAVLPSGPKSQFLSGRWNSLNELLTHGEEILPWQPTFLGASGW